MTQLSIHVANETQTSWTGSKVTPMLVHVVKLSCFDPVEDVKSRQILAGSRHDSIFRHFSSGNWAPVSSGESTAVRVTGSSFLRWGNWRSRAIGGLVHLPWLASTHKRRCVKARNLKKIFHMLGNTQASTPLVWSWDWAALHSPTILLADLVRTNHSKASWCHKCPTSRWDFCSQDSATHCVLHWAGFLWWLHNLCLHSTRHRFGWIAFPDYTKRLAKQYFWEWLSTCCLKGF